jgi:hypothetical protein
MIEHKRTRNFVSAWVITQPLDKATNLSHFRYPSQIALK